MKKTFAFLLTACLVVLVSSASAQFSNAGGAGGHGTARSGLQKETDNYSRISVAYHPMQFASGSDKCNLTGLSAGYDYGIHLTRDLPLFVEVGARVLYGFGKYRFDDYDDDYDYDYDYDPDEFEVKNRLLALDVPVAATYKFSFSNGLAVAPYLGINLRGLLMAQGEAWGEKISWFDKKELSDDETWSRFQVGWRLGVGLNYKRFYFGVGYGKDFTELCKKTKMSTTTIALGYTF